MTSWLESSFLNFPEQKLARYSPNTFPHPMHPDKLHFPTPLHLEGTLWSVLVNEMWEGMCLCPIKAVKRDAPSLCALSFPLCATWMMPGCLWDDMLKMVEPQHGRSLILNQLCAEDPLPATNCIDLRGEQEINCHYDKAAGFGRLFIRPLGVGLPANSPLPSKEISTTVIHHVMSKQCYFMSFFSSWLLEASGS